MNPNPMNTTTANDDGRIYDYGDKCMTGAVDTERAQTSDQSNSSYGMFAIYHARRAAKNGRGVKKVLQERTRSLRAVDLPKLPPAQLPRDEHPSRPARASAKREHDRLLSAGATRDALLAQLDGIFSEFEACVRRPCMH